MHDLRTGLDEGTMESDNVVNQPSCVEEIYKFRMHTEIGNNVLELINEILAGINQLVSLVTTNSTESLWKVVVSNLKK